MQPWRRIIFLATVLIAQHSPVVSASVPPNTRLKVLQFNFNSEAVRADSKNVIRDLRHQAIIDWVNANSPDVILIQEGWNYRSDPSIAVRLGRDLGYDVAYRLGIGFPGVEYDSTAILAKKQLGMSDEEDIKLPHSAPEIGNGKTWIIGLGAISYLIGVTLHLPGGEPLYMYSAHLLGKNLSQRADQSAAIQQAVLNRIAKDGGDWEQAHVIVGGDFNSDPTDPAISGLVGSGYQDSWEVAHPDDPGFSFCSAPTLPDFDPYTIISGLFPAQYNSVGDDRYDYVFVHSPVLKPLAATLTFTAPLEGVWMSDHYAVTATIGADEAAQPAPVPNPVRDSGEGLEASVIQTIADGDFLCSDPWNQDDPGCDRTLPDLSVSGPRGFTLLNASSFYVETNFTGPGSILMSANAAFNSKQRAAYVFDKPGDYTYRINNIAQAPNPYRSVIHGTIHVGAEAQSGSGAAPYF